MPEGLRYYLGACDESCPSRHKWTQYFLALGRTGRGVTWTGSGKNKSTLQVTTYSCSSELSSFWRGKIGDCLQYGFSRGSTKGTRSELEWQRRSSLNQMRVDSGTLVYYVHHRLQPLSCDLTTMTANPVNGYDVTDSVVSAAILPGFEL